MLPCDDMTLWTRTKGAIGVGLGPYRSRCGTSIYVVDEGVNVWYWIGSHNDYENFIGKK